MTEDRKTIIYDALVVGAGIAGGEAALNLANTGYKVLLVEKDRSIGGKMILLSKVFPTLDCAACITTPKVSEIARHKNITLFTESEVTDIYKKEDNDFVAQITKKPRFVRVEDCTACQLCEQACPVSVRDQYQFGLVGRKAAFIPFSIANPKAAAIDIDNCTLCGACEKVCPTHCIDFTMENGVHLHSMCRQIDGCANNVSEFIQGTKGSWSSNGNHVIKDLAGNVIWEYDGEAEKTNFKQTDPYTLEHVNLINTIRAGKNIEQASETAVSNMAAIMGRESAYTGLESKWDEMTASQLDYTPKDLNIGKMDMSGFVTAVPGSAQ